MELLIILGVTWLAGLAAFGGGLIARLEGSAESETKREIVHGMVAFGGGILLAAVAFALTPESMEVLPTTLLALTFLGGGLVFCGVDAALSRSQGNKAQFLAMLLDFIPEAIALGALFTKSRDTGIVLALFIGAQNLPEGFNTHRENLAGGMTNRRSLKSLFWVSLAGPISACGGYFLLSDHETITACLMSFASGGILYLIFQDIAPQAKLGRHWTPPLGAVLGFAFGMIGQQVLG